VRRKLRKKIREVLTRLSLIKRKFVIPSFPKSKNCKVLVHIGCGEIDSPEFINIDVRGFAHIHIITSDLTSLPSFEDESVDLIYMCHIFEHIKTPQLLSVLVEMKRLLKVGGILRLSVPDFDRILRIYEESDRDINAITQPLMGGQKHEYNIHYSVFNRRRLTELLEEAGFKKVLAWDPSNCEYHNFEDWASRKIKVNGKEYIISLNLEAIKGFPRAQLRQARVISEGEG